MQGGGRVRGRKLYKGELYQGSRAHEACRPMGKVGIKQMATNDLLSIYK